MDLVRPGSIEDLRTRFSHHPPRTAKAYDEHAQVRDGFWRLVEELHAVLPEGRNKALVFTALEEAQMRANAALAVARGLEEAAGQS